MRGFTVTETIAAAPAEVWSRLTDFARASEWMGGIEAMRPADDGPLRVGSRLRFTSRGKERDTRITALEAGKKIALTSTQGGVTATYTYSLAPSPRGTEITLNAVCTARGLWKLLHPAIVVAMRRADSPQLANLKSALGRNP